MFRFPEFCKLWASQAISEIGDYVSRVALAALLYQQTGSASATAFATVATVLPWAAGPVLSARLLFLSQRALMMWADTIRMVLMAVISLGPPPTVVVSLALLAGLCTPPFEAARTAVLIKAVPDPDSYTAARMVSHITFQSTALVGLLGGGLLVAHVGPRPALLLDAATYGLSLLFVARLRAGRDTRAEAYNWRAMLLVGFTAVLRDGIVRRAALLPISGMAGAIAAEALVVGFVSSSGALHRLGLLAATVPAATILGTVALNRVVDADHLGLLRVAHVTAGVGAAVALTGFSLPRATLTDLLAYSGVGLAFAGLAPLISIVGLRVPADDQTSAYSVLQATLRLGEALIALAGAGLSALLGVGPALAWLCAFTIVANLVGLAKMPADTRA